MANWQAAASVGELSAAPAPASPTGGPGAPPPLPFAGQPYPYAPQYAKPHRAAMLLVFGILGLVVCVIFGIVTWVMANNDLREMDRGVMDPSGRSTTSTARILGMVASILAIVGVGLGLLGLLLSLGVRSHAMR